MKLTVKEAAKYLNVSIPRIYALITEKRLPSARIEPVDDIPRKWFIDSDDLDAYTASKRHTDPTASKKANGRTKIPDKIFISTPMATLPDCMILDAIKKASEDGARNGVAPRDHYISGYTTDEPPRKYKHPELWYLGRSIMKMADCDEVVFTEGWEKSRGCMIERMVYDFYFKNYSSIMAPDILRGENDAKLMERIKKRK